MKETEFIDKVAYTLEGKKIGIVIRLEGKEDANVLSEKPRLIIKCKRIFAEPDIIQILVGQIKSTEHDKIIFNVTQSELKELKEAYRFERKKNLEEAKKTVENMCEELRIYNPIVSNCKIQE